MEGYENDTVYGKYLKIKNGPTGVRDCMRYIDDPEKTGASLGRDTLNGDASRRDILDGDTQDIPYARDAIDYIKNDPKVFDPATGKRLVSGHNCSPDTAAQEFALIEKLYHAHKSEKLAPGQRPNQAFHIILSYKGTDIAPDLVHEMGCEFARRLCGDSFQALIATHLNTGNYHDHILINAYALDGNHKFKDSYHAYAHFRDIANGISLEYGLPVFVNTGQKDRYKSWKEFISTQEGLCWKQAIIADLEQAIASSSSYGDVLKAMEGKGYTIQQNPRSITFIKDGIRVRDSRLGHRYTYGGITEALDRQAREKGAPRTVQDQQIPATQKRPAQQKPYPPIYIPRYDRYGKRRSFLLRLLLLFRESILQAMERAYGRPPHNRYPGHRGQPYHDIRPAGTIMPGQGHPDQIQAKKELQLLERMIRTAERYGITDPAVLEMELRGLHAKRAAFRSDILYLEDYLEGASRLEQLIDRYRQLEPIVASAGISIKDILSIPDTATVQKNRARSEPIRPKTRSALYQALHGSAYVLTRKFDTLTETGARQIIQAIREGRKEDLPDGLLPANARIRSYHDHEQTRKAVNRDTAAANSPISRQRPIVLKGYDDVTRQSILELKAIADELALYGLMDHASMDLLVKDMADKTAELDAMRNARDRIDTKIRDLYKLKKGLAHLQGLSAPSIGSFGPTGSSLDQLQKEHSRYDILAYMRTRLDHLDLLSLDYPSSDCGPGSDAAKTSSPDVYRFIHDLQTLYPETRAVDRTDPGAIHHLIASLENGDFLGNAMKKELEKERKEAPHVQDNTL